MKQKIVQILLIIYEIYKQFENIKIVGFKGLTL